MEEMDDYGHEVDAPSFFMFESTGDSEVDASPAERGTVAMEEDDAESCSCDDLGSERFESHDFEEECCEEGGGGGGGGGNAGSEEDARRDEGGGFGRYESCVSAESKSGGGFMNEMERNKLFWEACLAS